MLICDTHADTLWGLAHGKTEGFDVTREMLTAHPDDVRVQALALFVTPEEMAETPDIVTRELAALQKLTPAELLQHRQQRFRKF